jgi:hypothetical protein
MLTLIFGVVLGVVLCGLGIVTLPKLKTLLAAIKAKFAKAPVVAATVTTPPTLTPATTPVP